MQPSAYLVNTSRGEVVDEDALADLLAKASYRWCRLDVYADEPEHPEGLRIACQMLCYCRISARPPSRAGCKWVTRYYQCPDILGWSYPARSGD
jgi:hypothetical protein